jgi:3-oxoacyl-[acyl-carrier protein] reductase
VIIRAYFYDRKFDFFCIARCDLLFQNPSSFAVPLKLYYYCLYPFTFAIKLTGIITMNLQNKIALVTGGSRGIGAATVLKLAQEGADIAFTYGKAKDQADALAAKVKALGRRTLVLHLDAEKPDTAPALVDAVIKEFGTLDILVNNAGTWSMGMIGDIDFAEYERVTRINIATVFNLTNAAAKIMKSGARIINISSGLGERVPGPGMALYSATKFAVLGLTRGWARDLGPKGVLVNAILPGPIDTDMNPSDGQFAEYQKAATALGRYGKPEEIASAVAFLAGPDATYITGAELGVDGGWVA